MTKDFFQGPAQQAYSQDWLAFERDALWHPYSSLTNPITAYPVVSAHGVRLTLEDGRELIDGMASWWCVIHGYNHPSINQALHDQIEQVSHVMFGGLTHRPAAQLAARLIDITPPGLDKLFFADSGSVSVEVAIKMALQFWQAQGQANRTRLLTIRSGYHGDTFGAMSVCDPVGGMHSLFQEVLPQQFFVTAPGATLNSSDYSRSLDELEQTLRNDRNKIAAMILEPVVQGAGGMRFYPADYVKYARELCDRYDVLLIADEIATGFGRSGHLFACDAAGISPDILCVGKALTGGYMTLAATLTTQRVAEGICNGDPGVFMHGPTFMANPLACAAANASLELLFENGWFTQVSQIEAILNRELGQCIDLPAVKDVRVKGAIGVVELHEPVDMHSLPEQFVQRGVWIRPFRNLVYVMPPYVISEVDLNYLCITIRDILSAL